MTRQSIFGVLCVCLTFCHVDAYTVKDVNALKATLMEGYNKDTNPSAGLGPQNVSVRVFVSKIGDLDERLEKLTTDIELNMHWNDSSMSWNKTENGIDHLEVDRDDVWVPEVFVYNKHSQITYGIAESRYLPVVYWPSGKAAFAQMVTAETWCMLDTSAFPFDQHTCEVEFQVNKWNTHINASFTDMILEHYKPDGSWDVINASMVDHNNVMITVNLTLGRKPMFVLVNIVFPMAMLSLLSPLVFLLPNHSGERVGYSITVLLATSVFMTIVADHMPQKSSPFPLLLTMFFILYSLNVVVVMVVIINARIYCLPDHVRIPRPLRRLLGLARWCCCCFQRREQEESYEEEMTLKGSEGKIAASTKESKWEYVGWAVDMVCIGLFYVLKILLVVVFMIVLKAKVA